MIASLTGLVLAYEYAYSTSIVAVHGLNGHRRATWTSTSATRSSILWLKDLLPSEVPNARILSYGYDARTHGSSPISNQYLFAHAQEFVTALVQQREKTNVRNPCIPVVTVAASLITTSIDYASPDNIHRT